MGNLAILFRDDNELLEFLERVKKVAFNGDEARFYRELGAVIRENEDPEEDTFFGDLHETITDWGKMLLSNHELAISFMNELGDLPENAPGPEEWAGSKPAIQTICERCSPAVDRWADGCTSDSDD